MRALVAALIAPLLVASICAQGGMVMPTLTSLSKGDMSGVEDARQVTVRSPAEWQKLWKEHSPREPLPAVDFKTKMVVGIFLGSKPSSGYGVEILGAKLDGKELIVEFAQKQPGHGVMTAQVLTSPYHLVAVPKHAGAVKFVRVKGIIP
jgi:hypothetical protein